ncbi:hypothetical protein A3Q56_04370 [Intoshia linei]|uniref:Uncharacterized protein n=1 Tax=Intoshia linei TaxID=1819745 RepID=A0A177B2C7_9BILA|nr:hypothetical protein A3Q56_04370 [Intoshia linei]
MIKPKYIQVEEEKPIKHESRPYKPIGIPLQAISNANLFIKSFQNKVSSSEMPEIIHETENINTKMTNNEENEVREEVSTDLEILEPVIKSPNTIEPVQQKLTKKSSKISFNLPERLSMVIEKATKPNVRELEMKELKRDLQSDVPLVKKKKKSKKKMRHQTAVVTSTPKSQEKIAIMSHRLSLTEANDLGVDVLDNVNENDDTLLDKKSKYKLFKSKKKSKHQYQSLDSELVLDENKLKKKKSFSKFLSKIFKSQKRKKEKTLERKSVTENEQDSHDVTIVETNDEDNVITESNRIDTSAKELIKSSIISNNRISVSRSEVSEDVTVDNSNFNKTNALIQKSRFEANKVIKNSNSNTPMNNEIFKVDASNEMIQGVALSNLAMQIDSTSSNVNSCDYVELNNYHEANTKNVEKFIRSSMSLKSSIENNIRKNSMKSDSSQENLDLKISTDVEEKVKTGDDTFNDIEMQFKNVLSDFQKDIVSDIPIASVESGSSEMNIDYDIELTPLPKFDENDTIESVDLDLPFFSKSETSKHDSTVDLLLPNFSRSNSQESIPLPSCANSDISNSSIDIPYIL